MLIPVMMSSPSTLKKNFRGVDIAAERGDRRLFEGIHFDLEPGQLLQVAGRNGCGKTTLLRILCGLSRPRQGEVYWGDEPIRSIDGGIGVCLGYLGHQNALKEDLSCEENLLFAGRLGGFTTDPEAAREMLERLGLGGYEDVPTRFLSQGQKRRVALSRLLLNRLPLWILDEPYAALDTQVIEVLKQSIEAHLDAGGMIIITTHQTVEIAGDCHYLRLA